MHLPKTKCFVINVLFQHVMPRYLSEKEFLEALFFDGSDNDVTSSDADNINNPSATYISDVDSLQSDSGGEKIISFAFGNKLKIRVGLQA